MRPQRGFALLEQGIARRSARRGSGGRRRQGRRRGRWRGGSWRFGRGGHRLGNSGRRRRGGGSRLHGGRLHVVRRVAAGIVDGRHRRFRRRARGGRRHGQPFADHRHSRRVVAPRHGAHIARRRQRPDQRVALPAGRGDLRQQVLRPGLEGTIRDLLLGGTIGQLFRLVELPVVKQRLGLFHQQAGIGAATRFRVAIQRHDLLVLGDGRLDLRRAVVQRSIADLQTLGLVEPLDGAADITHGQGAPREPQQVVALGPPAGAGRHGLPGQGRGQVLIVRGRRRRQDRRRAGRQGSVGGGPHAAVERVGRRIRPRGRPRRRVSLARRSAQSAVGVANLLQGLAGLPRRVLHGDRRVFDLQRFRLGDQHLRGRQIVFPHRLACPPQEIGRLLPLVVRRGTGPLGLGHARGADQDGQSAAGGSRQDPACREAQNDCHPSA